jgi:short-subunit dehydrogenase
VVGLERDIVGATYALFSTNVDGVFNTILPLLAPMKERKAGRIIIMSSLASQGAMPGAVAYSATKAAVRTYGEALRGLLYRDGVRVNVVCPGYTESEMTKANTNHMVGLMSMERAVRIIVAGIARDTAVITFPTTVHTVFWAFARVLPPALVHALSRRRLSMVPPTNYLRQRSQKKKAA